MSTLFSAYPEDAYAMRAATEKTQSAVRLGNARTLRDLFGRQHDKQHVWLNLWEKKKQ